MPTTRSGRKRRALATTGTTTTPADTANSTCTHPSYIHTTTIGLEDLPLEILAAIADFVHEYPLLCATMLVSRRLHDGVSLSRRWRIRNEVAADVEDVQEQRRILFDREQVIIHASRLGNMRCLRYVQLTEEEAYSLCLPVACLHGHLECVRYLMAEFDIKDTIVCSNLFPARLGTAGCEDRMKRDYPSGVNSDIALLLSPIEIACGCSDGLPLLMFFHEECGVTADDIHMRGGVRCLWLSSGNGHLPVVQYLHTAFKLTADDVRANEYLPVRGAIENGQLPVVQYLHTAFGLTADDARANDNGLFNWACCTGILPVVQYLHTAFGLTADDARADNSHALWVASKNGHLPVVQYLHTAFGLTADDARAMDNDVLRIACEHGRLPVVQYLHTAFGLTANDARFNCLAKACKHGRLSVVQYLITAFSLGLGDLMGACAGLGEDVDLSVFNSMHVSFS